MSGIFGPQYSNGALPLTDAEMRILWDNINNLTTTAIAGAVWSHTAATDLASRVAIAQAILQNKSITDPATGLMTVFAADGVTPLLTAMLYEGTSTAKPYSGQGAERRERLQ